jgi:hypothetical protein
MLPGLRLIAVGFLCGFVVMFVGLRAVFSVNIVHASLPVMAAQATQSAPPGMIEPRGAPSATPALYDLRLVASTVTPQFASLMVPMVERAVSEPAPLIEDAFEESPSPRADEPTPPADAVDERQAALAPEPVPIEPPATAAAESSLAPPAEPMADSEPSEPPSELLLESISQPTAPVESKVAAIATDPERASIAIEAPKPAEAKLKRAAAKPARKKRARVARATPPRNGIGNGSGNPFGNDGPSSFGSHPGSPFGNAGGGSFGTPSGNSIGNRWN